MRIAGRKSISQMTIAHTVIMISIGTLLIQPVTEQGYWTMFFTGAVLVGSLLVIEYVQLKWDWAERLLTGRAVPVIENGTVSEANLAKVRMTFDQLEKRLRVLGVSRLSDVKSATLEASGELGYELKEEKEPATKEDMKKLMQWIEHRLSGDEKTSPADGNDLFTEVVKGHHAEAPSRHLQ